MEVPHCSLSSSWVTHRVCPDVAWFLCGAGIPDLPGFKNHLVLKCGVWSSLPETSLQLVGVRAQASSCLTHIPDDSLYPAVWKIPFSGGLVGMRQEALSSTPVSASFCFLTLRWFEAPIDILRKVIFLIAQWFSKCGPRTPDGFSALSKDLQRPSFSSYTSV